MLLLLACVSTPTLLLEPDPSRSGEGGSAGPFGAAHLTHRFGARATDVVTVDYVYPADEHAEPRSLPGGWPLMLFLHGGAVAPERYLWFAAHFASRGYAVGLPHHALDLALFEAGNARVAREGLLEEDAEHLSGRAAIGGHSLGGVVSVIDWVAEPGFEAVFLAASYADEGTDPADRAESPALSLSASEDENAPPSEVAAGAARFVDVVYGEVQGMNHFDWVDAPTEAELARDGTSIGTEQTRRHAMAVVDSFFDATLRDDTEAQATLDARDFTGVVFP